MVIDGVATVFYQVRLFCLLQFSVAKIGLDGGFALMYYSGFLLVFVLCLFLLYLLGLLLVRFQYLL